MRRLLFILLFLPSFCSAQIQSFWMLNGQEPASSYDADAQAYFNRVTTAGGMLTDPQKTAVNTFYLAVKADNVWTSLYDFHLYLGGSAAAYAVGGKQTGSITWSGSPTINSTGIAFNGTSQYGNTGVTANTVGTLNSMHLSIYLRTATNMSLSGMIGCEQGNAVTRIIPRNGGNAWFAENNLSTAQSVGYAPSQPNTAGYFINTRIGSGSYEIYRNGTLGATVSIASSAVPTRFIFIGATASSSNTVAFYGDQEVSFSSYGTGLTSTQSTALSTHVATLIAALGR